MRAKRKFSGPTQGEFLRRSREIYSSFYDEEAKARSQRESDWFFAFLDEKKRADDLESRLAILEAEIASGQLVDIRTVPRNESVTASYVKRVW